MSAITLISTHGYVHIRTHTFLLTRHIMCVYDLTRGGVTGERAFKPMTTVIFKNDLWTISAQCVWQQNQF